MNRRSLIRKLIYVLLIAALLVPLSYYSQPAVVSADSQTGGGQPAAGPRVAQQLVGGGKLAQLREQYGISESSLGEIDPTGETIKLATLGLRGVAVNLLWHKVEEAKKKEDWDGFQATLDQIAKLEPHYINVWDYQGWNVSYNIAVEFDDYHDRYFWLKEGIKFLLRGTRYNDREPHLPFKVGEFCGQKIGTADEKVQYRRLFREDDDEEFPNHRNRQQIRRDNWLVAQEYYGQDPPLPNSAIGLVENRGASIRKKNPLVFYSKPGMCQIDYAIALEEDGIFEEKAKVGWSDADDYWKKFAQRAIPATFGMEIRLNDEEVLKQQAEDLVKQLDSLAPDLREKMVEERRAKLTSYEREVLEIPPMNRTQEEMAAWWGAQQKLVVPHKDLAARMDEPLREKAARLADEAAAKQQLADLIHSDRTTVNFNYWKMRCQAEKMDEALEGRRLLYEANDFYENTQLEEARESYEKGFAQWRHVVDRFPEMRDDTTGGTSIDDAIKGYFNVLRQLDEPFPKDFVLMDVARSMMRRIAVSVPQEFLETINEGADKDSPPAVQRDWSGRPPDASRTNDSQADNNKADNKADDAKSDDSKSDDAKSDEAKANSDK